VIPGYGARHVSDLSEHGVLACVHKRRATHVRLVPDDAIMR